MKLNPKPRQAALPNPTLVAGLALSDDGGDVIVGQTASADHPALSRWDVPSLSRLDDISGCPLSEGQDTCNVLSRTGGLLAVAGITGQRLTLIDLDSDTRTQPTQGHVVWAALRGDVLATGGARAQIRDPRSGELLWQQDPPATPDPNYPSRAPLVAPHPGGRQFAVGGTGAPDIRLHSLAGDHRTTLTGAPPRLRWLEYSPDGTYLVALDASVRSMVVWRSGEESPHLPDEFTDNAPQIWSIAFHPDGRHCAVGMLSGVIRLYRLSDGELLDRQSLHLGRVQALAFTPDGSTLFSGGDDGKLLCWAVE
ncbi:WD40 repeat domain-containing protein [Micromonospora rubida]|uniref:WD40 repeat domain-containing protein n=1 Tax=Micromonospora rubida TaxID=2697657 RepID=A0ABW7SJZ0_9ACTN